MTTTETPPEAGTAPYRGGHARPGLALLVIATAQLMVVLDATIVNIALPAIQRALAFSQTDLSWVLNAYTLTFGGLLLLGGRSGDLFGRRRMFVVGVSLFALASLLGGFATSQGFLLAMRALQGVGGAIASPTALSLVTATFEEGPARNKAFGVYAAVSGAGAALGLILGGVLTDYLDWRWVLFVNAPIGLALAIATPFVVAESRGTGSRKLDVPGAVLVTGGVASLVYAFIHAASMLSQGRATGDAWGNRTTLTCFALAAILLVAFVITESRLRQPLMPLRLFASAPRVGSYIVMLITGAAVFAMFFFLTQFVQEVLHYSPLKAGFSFLPVSLVIIVLAQTAGRLVGRTGPRPLIAAGALFAGLGLLYLSTLSVSSDYLTGVLPGLALTAMGMGLIFVPITLGAVAGVRPEDTGVASAMLNVGQQVGGTVGLSSLVTVFSMGFKDDVQAQLRGLAARSGGHLPPQVATGLAHRQLPAAIQNHAFTHGATNGFRFGAVLLAVALVAALALIRVPAGVHAPEGAVAA